jgi:CRP/FNR family transcriptional regulator, cyclic AMP receptor protein
MTRAGQIWNASRLAELPERYGTALLPLSVERTYERGETVGSARPWVSLVISGQICGYLIGNSGRRIVYRYYGSGDIVGLLAVIRPGIDRATARTEHAAVRRTRVLEFPAGRLRDMSSHDAFATQLLSRLLAQDLLEGRRGLTDHVFLSVRQMLARHLLLRAIRVGDQVVVEATQEELASAVGSVRAVVARTLLELRAEGLVDRNKLGLLIPDPAALAAEAQGRTSGGNARSEPRAGTESNRSECT